MHTRFQLFLLPLLVASCAPPERPTAHRPSTDRLEEQVVQATNQIRFERGRAALTRHDALDREAKAHSRRMASRSKLSHHGSTERAERLYRALPVAAVAENVAQNRGFEDSVSAAIEGWLGSRSHRKNLLGDFHWTGIGVATARDGTIYYTQLFARQAPSPP